MSHTVKATITADQEIELLGKTINIHELKALILNSKGKVICYSLEDKKVKEANNEQN